MTRSKSKKRLPTNQVITKMPQTGEEYGLFTPADSAWSPLLRIVGQNKPLQLTVTEWLAVTAASVAAGEDGTVDNSLVHPIVTTSTAAEDYAAIDLRLAIQVTPILSEEPRVGTGYAGFTPAQRYHFLQWITHVDLAAPPAFRHLYLAHLETNLFDKPRQQQAAHQELRRLVDLAAWQGEELLWRALLFSFQLTARGEELRQWLPTAHALPMALLGVALGQLALLNQPLTVEQLSALLVRWQLADSLPAQPILQLRLDFLINSLGDEPLAYLRKQLDATVLHPKPWRSAHRDLRLQLIQLDLRQGLASLLRDLSRLADHPAEGRNATADEEGTDTDRGHDIDREGSGSKSKKKWQLVLEFGESRSDYFIFALNQAQRMPGYLQIMDENRRMVHRVNFEKSEMRRFWSIWEYVQSWSSTQVYFNGKEVQKIYIYPYSPYLR